MKFKLISEFKPTGDQPQAIKRLTENLKFKNLLCYGACKFLLSLLFLIK